MTTSAGTSSGIQILDCTEYGTVPVPIADLLNQYGELDFDEEVQAGFFNVQVKRRVLQLRAEGWVGYIPLNDRVVVHVVPRVPVNELTRIAHLSEERAKLLASVRGYEGFDSWSEMLDDLYAVVLADEVRRIISRGFHREYQRRAETTSFPHGRILVGETVQRHMARNIRHRAETTYFERSADTAANRCLKYAMWALAQRFQARTASDRREKQFLRQRLVELNALYPAFDAVPLDHSRSFLHDPTVAGDREFPQLRAYYALPVRLAAMLIKREGVQLEKETKRLVTLPSLVINMPDVFEAFLRNVLRDYATRHAWPVRVLNGEEDGGRALYTTRESPQATPDIVVVPENQFAQPLVMDVKYIPTKQLPKRDGVDQVITYASAYGTRRVVLIHPADAGQASGMTVVGSVGPVELLMYRFDLGAVDLDAEIEAFGDAVRALLPVPALLP